MLLLLLLHDAGAKVVNRGGQIKAISNGVAALKGWEYGGIASKVIIVVIIVVTRNFMGCGEAEAGAGNQNGWGWRNSDAVVIVIPIAFRVGVRLFPLLVDGKFWRFRWEHGHASAGSLGLSI